MYIIIQIKICAEYRDMLPRPSLVCQKPGLRPIGRSRVVPDKSSRRLIYMARYSAMLDVGQVRLFLKIQLSQEFDSSQTAVKPESASLFKAIRHENVEKWK